MAYTQEELNNLKSIIASGVKEVVYNGRKLTYQDVSDLIKASNAISAEVDSNSASSRRGIIRVSAGSGF